MRAVQSARNQVLKQQLAEVNPKFQAGANELEKEGELKILQPTNAEQLKQMTTLVEALRRQNLGDVGWQNALRFWQMQITTGALSDRVKFEFVRRFYFWLLGRGTTADTEKTAWGRANVAALNREVALYVEQFAQRRLDYAMQLALLAVRVPSTLNGYYLYFKYIVNGKLKRAKDTSGGSWWELSDDDYLQDFEMFQQEFGADGQPHYKDIIRPAATQPNKFDASRPYPASKDDMERNKHEAKTVAAMLKETETQLEEEHNEELPEKMDTDEDGVEELPQHAPPKQAVPIPANEAAVTQAREEYIAAQQRATQMIGKLREELRVVKNKHGEETRTAVGNMMQQARAEAAQVQREYDRRLAEHQRGGDALLRSQQVLQAENAKLQQMMQMMQEQAKRYPADENVHAAANATRKAQVRVNAAAQKFFGEPRGFPFKAPEDMEKMFHKATSSSGAEAKRAQAEVASEFASSAGESTGSVMAAVREYMDTAEEVQEVADEVHFPDPTRADTRTAYLKRLSHELFVAHNTTKQESERAQRAEADAQLAAAQAARNRITEELKNKSTTAAQIHRDEERRRAAARLAEEMQEKEQELARETQKANEARLAEARVMKKAAKHAALARKEARRLRKEEEAKQKLAAEAIAQLTEAETEIDEDVRDENPAKRDREEEKVEEEVVAKATKAAEASVTEEDTPEQRAALEMPTTETETEEDTPAQKEALDRAQKARVEKEKLKRRLAAQKQATQQAREAKLAAEDAEARAVVARLAKEMDEGGRLRSEFSARLHEDLERVDPQTSGGDESDVEWGQHKKLQQVVFKSKRLGLNLKMPRHAPSTRKQAKELIKGIRDQIIHAQYRTFRTRNLKSKRKQ